jgi:hypothetical protein
MTFSFSLKKSQQRNPLQVPNRAPMERATLYRAFFYISLKFLIKISLNTEIFPLFQRPYERSIPPCSPKAGPLWKQTSIARALLSISVGVTSKGALPPDSPHRAPSERDTPFLEPSFIHLSMSLEYKPPSRFPSGAPLERDAHLQSLPLHILQGPQ